MSFFPGFFAGLLAAVAVLFLDLLASFVEEHATIKKTDTTKSSL